MAKKLTLFIGILAISFTVFVLSVRADVRETVSLESEGDKIKATLELPETSKEEIVALQLSFQIEPEQGSVSDVSFEFDPGISGSAVTQYRYQQESGILNIYISGKNDIYGDQKTITLGKVVVNSNGNTSVRVEKDSFKTVNKAFDKYEGEVNIGNGGQIVNNKPADPSGDKDDGDNSEIEGGDLPGNNDSGTDGDIKDDIVIDGESDGPETNNNGGDHNSSGNTSAQKKDNDRQIWSLKAGGAVTGTKKMFHPIGTENDNDSERTESEEAGSSEPEDASLEEDQHLTEDGVAFWKEKISSLDTDVWSKVFWGLLAIAGTTAIILTTVMIVSNSNSKKKKRIRHMRAKKTHRKMSKAHSTKVQKTVRKSSGKKGNTGQRRKQEGKPRVTGERQRVQRRQSQKNHRRNVKV